ncbi:nitrile hydratase subunit beta [Bosea sp. 685]|uniref:nitrile hydratase subunit beta n=1 Tax=Bosea sp. 685 TaxID=3080057 RepID=UPI002892A360|nr:nitrile hydratase subunit beta [Bosea sp. 685]WNJ87922.1 nitrile hydratase subunit beta [Bosea sp. 685]
MKLQHYLGGLEGLGEVSTEVRVFVEPWETRIFGIHTAMMALSPQLPLPSTASTFHTVWTWADLRKGAEALNPFDYFRYRYYEKWLGGISAYFIANGYVTAEELDAETEEYYRNPDRSLPRGGGADIDERIGRYLVEGDSPRRDEQIKPRFAKGDHVLVRDVASVEHTRLPGYLRGHLGVIEAVYEGAYAYLCDTGPDGIGPPMHVYCVRFDPSDIWPGNAEANFAIYADLFDSYLKPPAVTARAA